MNDTTNPEDLVSGAGVTIGTGKDTGVVSLLDLGQFDMNEVEEFRQVQFPPGVYEWQLLECELVERETKDGVKRAVISMPMQCTNVISAPADPTIQIDQLIGKKFIENIWIADPKMALGEFKAFCNDINFQESGTLVDLLARMEGLEFVAPIRHARNPNDKDRPYTNLVRDKGKVRPVDNG